jgi:nucleoside-diphosphate-sugar epimerase
MREPLAIVTGCPGWLGNRLLHFLAEAHPDWPEGPPQPVADRVRCLILPGTRAERLGELHPGVEAAAGDIRDPVAVDRLLEGAESAVVYHLAGIIHPRRVRDFHEVNAVGTRNLLRASRAAGVGRVVATSSNSPVGVSRNPDDRFDESSPYRPYLAYGRSKRDMEDALNAAPVETVVLRPCWFYGPEQPARQTTFFTMIKEGKAPIVGGGESRRSMSYVDNAALGILLAAAVPRAAGRTYWIADERPYSMNEIVDTVESVLEDDFGIPVAHERMRLPGFASELAYAVDVTLQRLGLYQQKIHVLSEMNKTIACSVERARDELGYAPGVALREGMRRSVEWCLTNGQTI